MVAKKCYTCGDFKAGIYFAPMEKNCMECVADLKEDAKLRAMDKSLQSRYGITLADYNSMFRKQKGKCAICGKHQMDLNTKLYVDHCHVTGKVRALLCNPCNTQVGVYENSDLEALKAYVDSHSTETAVQ
jgi:hypothetical protein